MLLFGYKPWKGGLKSKLYRRAYWNTEKGMQVVRFQTGKKDKVRKNKMRDETDVKRREECLQSCRSVAVVQA